MSNELFFLLSNLTRVLCRLLTEEYFIIVERISDFGRISIYISDFSFIFIKYFMNYSKKRLTNIPICDKLKTYRNEKNYFFGKIRARCPCAENFAFFGARIVSARKMRIPPADLSTDKTLGQDYSIKSRIKSALNASAGSESKPKGKRVTEKWKSNSYANQTLSTRRQCSFTTAATASPARSLKTR